MQTGPLCWTLNGEMFSEEAKSVSSSLATAANWTTTFMVNTRLKVDLHTTNSQHPSLPTQVTRFSNNIACMINNSGMYFLYASVSLACFVFTFFLVPETKGKSSEEMKAHFMPREEKESPKCQET